VKARAAAILIQNDKIALIERNRSGRHYFVLPGGKIEPGETPASAVAREIKEELGLDVTVGSMVAKVRYLGSPQYYFLANSIGGRFGDGTGKEMRSLPDTKKGSYFPIWLPVDELQRQPVLPKLVAKFIRESHLKGWPDIPLIVTDRLPDEP
jgi:mutator protein MutT